METTVDVSPTIRCYFSALERYDIDSAVACFSEDAFYSHPTYSNTPETRFYRGEGMRMEVHNRQDLRKLFEDRGKLPIQYQFVAAASQGSTTFVTGIASQHGERLASFISYATLTDDGLISRYETYSSTPPVGDPAPPAYH